MTLFQQEQYAYSWICPDCNTMGDENDIKNQADKICTKCGHEIEILHSYPKSPVHKGPGPFPKKH